MGRNNQQKRKAKAKARHQARARQAADDRLGGGFDDVGFGFGFEDQPPPPPDGAGPWGAFGPGAGFVPPRTAEDRRADAVERTVMLALRWRRMAQERQPDQAQDALDDLIVDLGRPGHRAAVGRHLSRALVELVEASWGAGWEPADLARVVERRLADESLPVLRDAIATSMDRHTATTIAPRWHAQRDDVEAVTWWPADSDPLLERLGGGDPSQVAGVLYGAIEACDLLAALPPLEPIDPPPGRWRASAATTSGEPAPDRILHRVRALLAKAESTTFDAEAESLTSAAQSLMSRHSIDLAMLAASHPRRAGDVPIVRRLGVDRPYEAPKATLLTAVADANRCRTVWAQDLGLMTVIGYLADVEAVETLYTSLHLQATRAMALQGSRGTRTGGSRTRSFRQSFLLAYAHRIGQRLQEAADQEIDQTQVPDGVAAGSGVLAVLDARSAEVDAAVERLFPSLRTASSGSIRDVEGWHAGMQAADHATLFGDHDRLEA